MSNPTPAHTNEDNRAAAIATFQTLTGTDSAAAAERELSASNWDLNRAVDHFLEHGPRPERPSPLPPRQQESLPAPRVVRENRVVPHQRPGGGFWSWLMRVAWAPLGFVAHIAAKVWNAFTALFQGPYQTIPGGSVGLKQFYEEKYGTHHVQFFPGSFFDATARCQGDVTFLVVYLHAEGHPCTKDFCERILNSEVVAQTVREGRLLFWAGSVGGMEGTALQRVLRVSGLPYVGVIEPSRTKVQNNERGDGGVQNALLQRSRMGGYGRVLASKAITSSIIAEGPEAFTGWLQRVERMNGYRLDSIIAKRQERENQRRLREEQDEAFQEALREDQIRVEMERERRDEAARLEFIRELNEERRKEKAAGLGAEPEPGVDVCALRIRNPDGTTAMRRFKVDELLGKVFDWVDVLGIDPKIFRLVSSYPRKQWRYPEDAGTTLKDAGFYPSTSLMLEARDY